jgi:hypothetical protein
MSPAMTVEGGTTAAVFATYLECVLTPALRPGQLVVVDNVGAQARANGRAGARSRLRADLPARLLPGPLPGRGGIQQDQNRVKAAGARTHQALDAAIATALETVTPDDAAGWFTHAGYLSPQTT